jgi:radical SAM superfamily enzyme YgiQ (UPF0313 family)
LASPLGFLKRAGYGAEALDTSVEGFDAEKIKRARFIGLSVPMHTALRLGVRLAERIREINPSCHICFYGLYASLNAEYLLKHVADSVIGGEFEESLISLIDALEKGEPPGGTLGQAQTPSPELNGVSFRGKISPPPLKRLNFAVPLHCSLPPLREYAHLERDNTRGVVGYVEASRGCSCHCRHCPIPSVYNGRFFVVPQEVVLKEVEQLVEAGATHITFGDPDFLNGPGHSLRIVRAMHRNFPELTFDFTAKVEHLLSRRTLLPEFADSGCVFVVSAFESLSNTVLENLSKGHSRDDIYAALEMFRDVGIPLRPTWVPFTPWTTLEDYIDILEFITDEGLVYHVDPVQCSIRLLIPPRSALLGQGSISPFLGQLDQAAFTYRWAHPDPRMDELHALVSVVVERMIQSGEDTVAIFDRVRALAYAASGRTPPPPKSSVPAGHLLKAPRLTEAWFC